MLQTGSVTHQTVQFRALSDDQVEEIKRAAFDILENVGCQVLHDEAQALLKQAGAFVSQDRVRLPEHVVLSCLATAPKGFTIYDRQGQRALEVEGRKSYYGTSTASPRTRDAHTGEIHETRVADIALSAKIADALPNIDWVMPMGSSQDVPGTLADVHEFRAVATHTTKPIVFIGYTPQGTRRVFEMAAEVAGGMDRLRERPFLLLYPEPISPLVYPPEVVDRILIAADLFMPQIIGPAIQLGATAPVTMAGAIAQVVAESLVGVVLSQLRRPGTPVVLGANIAVFDMLTSMMVEGGPEMSLGLAGQAEVARSFGLPTWGLAGCTDSKVLDVQAGLESAFSILAQGLAGLNLIHDVGYMDSGMICSAEMLVLGDEVIGMTKRFVRGIEVTAETLARDVIAGVGPGGHYLADDHTYNHFRQELWMPTLLARQDYARWEEDGSKDVPTKIHEKIEEIDQTHEVPPLADNVLATLDRAVEVATAEEEAADESNAA
jgi:trimethylamine--corrinoid protein Co-methyltransferase